MDRREFAVTVAGLGIGAMLPTDLIASLVAKRSNALVRMADQSLKNAGKIRMVCLGSEECPASLEEINQTIEFMKTHGDFMDASKLRMAVYEADLEGLTLIMGSADRPASDYEFSELCKQLSKLTPGDTIVSHHNLIPLRFPINGWGTWVGKHGIGGPPTLKQGKIVLARSNLRDIFTKQIWTTGSGACERIAPLYTLETRDIFEIPGDPGRMELK